MPKVANCEQWSFALLMRVKEGPGWVSPVLRFMVIPLFSWWIPAFSHPGTAGGGCSPVGLETPSKWMLSATARTPTDPSFFPGSAAQCQAALLSSQILEPNMLFLTFSWGLHLMLSVEIWRARCRLLWSVKTHFFRTSKLGTNERDEFWWGLVSLQERYKVKMTETYFPLVFCICSPWNFKGINLQA